MVLFDGKKEFVFIYSTGTTGCPPLNYHHQQQQQQQQEVYGAKTNPQIYYRIPYSPDTGGSSLQFINLF
jgi:hypothetical protein